MVHKKIIRISTAGSVDNGKSTLIGRLFYDSKKIYKDQLNEINYKKNGENTINLAHLTDGLKEEREKGITIDVAYRYFSTPKLKFILADTPGHKEYTRNMVTGASTADVIIILIDAEEGLSEQTKRHTIIAALLNIKHFLICVNKMDLLNFKENVFIRIVHEYQQFLKELNIEKKVQFIPISALLGENILSISNKMKWYKGRSLFDCLENIDTEENVKKEAFLFPVQTVIREENTDIKSTRYAGQIAAGVINKGQQVRHFPSRELLKVQHIFNYSNSLPCAYAPMSISLQLKSQFQLKRGDLLVATNATIKSEQLITVRICWFNEDTLKLNNDYIIKHTANEISGIVTTIINKINIDTMKANLDDHTIRMNDVATIEIQLSKEIFATKYIENKQLGSLILINPMNNETVAAGMIL